MSGRALLLSAILLMLVGIFLDATLARLAPLEGCIEASAGRGGRVIARLACSPQLFGMGSAGIVRFAAMWAWVLPLLAFFLRRGR